MFSIALCSWNDLRFLKILVAGIKRNTKLPYEIVIHDNGSEDGTLEWLNENNIIHTRTEKNEGVAAVNYAVEQAKYEYIIDLNADMYPLPNWDLEIYKQIQHFKRHNVDKFTISSKLIEPVGENPEYTIAYNGHTAETFNEETLLWDYYNTIALEKEENTTQYSHPITMPKKLWDEFGGVDMRYKYGIATDHDIPASAYKAGCRNFVMLARSRVYHFVSQTVRKLPADRGNGHETFKEKWGISVEDFRKEMEIAKPYKSVKDEIL